MASAFGCPTRPLRAPLARTLSSAESRLPKAPPTRLKAPTGTCFSATYRPIYSGKEMFVPWTDLAGSVFEDIQTTKRAQMKQVGLWWTVISETGVVSPKAAIRRWSRKRLRRTVSEQLAAQGYDANGLSLRPGKPSLKGSLILRAKEPILHTKNDLFQTEVGRLVHFLCTEATGNR